jgi:rubrerythrin
MKRLSLSQVRFFIKDERHAAKEYMRLGLPQLASDEKRHQRFFERLYKRLTRRG